MFEGLWLDPILAPVSANALMLTRPGFITVPHLLQPRVGEGFISACLRCLSRSIAIQERVLIKLLVDLLVYTLRICVLWIAPWAILMLLCVIGSVGWRDHARVLTQGQLLTRVRWWPLLMLLLLLLVVCVKVVGESIHHIVIIVASFNTARCPGLLLLLVRPLS